MDVAGEWLGCLDLIVHRRVECKGLVQDFYSLQDDKCVFLAEVRVHIRLP